jgi:5-methylcytosine-specific restriction endonuclease McrA
MKIDSIKRPWIKNEQRKKHIDTFYQSSTWKNTVDRIWVRDKGMCQLCLQKGIKHYLERGTKDLTKQGTVDHIERRALGFSDDDSNLWLIGSNHHNSKRAFEKNKQYGKR